MKCILTLFTLLQCYFLTSQCTYLAYDGFDYSPNIPMEGLAGGTGWESPWHVQNNNSNVPGFNTVANSLTFSNLQVVGNAGIGGYQYLTLGRRINTGDNGPFASFVASGQNGIGTAIGDTLWSSFIMSKDADNDQSVFVSMHDDNTGWCNDCTTEKVAVGYFGSNSNSGGQRYWTLSLNNTYYLSSTPVGINQSTFL